jgi:hypothetical protein
VSIYPFVFETIAFVTVTARGLKERLWRGTFMGAENATDRSSLMEVFVLQKTRDYREPQRRGTPRSQPKAFSAPKFAAAVYCLKNTSLREIATAVPVSYGLLRKWRTEERFLSLLSTLSEEFVDQVVLRHLRRRAEVQLDLDQAYIDQTITKIAETPPPQLGWRDFRDLSFYSQGVLGLLAERLHRIQIELTNGSEPGKEGAAMPQRRGDLYMALQCEGLLALGGAHLRTPEEGPRKGENPIFACGEARVEAEYKRSVAMLVDGPLKQDERKRMVVLLHRLRGRFTPVELEDRGVEAEERGRPAKDDSVRKPIGRHLL